MTDELQRTLCEHAAGNRRLLMNLCGDALALGVSKNAKRLDDGLYLEMTGADHRPPAPRPKPAPARDKSPSRR
jgi:hypothetical protein